MRYALLTPCIVKVNNKWDRALPHLSVVLLFSDDYRSTPPPVHQILVGFCVITAQQHCLVANLLTFDDALILVENPNLVFLVY